MTNPVTREAEGERWIDIRLREDDAVRLADFLAGLGMPIGDEDTESMRALYGALAAALELQENGA